ncbi:MAG: hypothetical protein H6633_13495 [Anaerolineales bacterium]|nr:hypothetical protein [Anaerolineales bacterium]
MDKLKELGLGIKTEKIEVEKVTVDEGCLLSISKDFNWRINQEQGKIQE